MAQTIKNPAAMQETQARSLSWDREGNCNPLQYSCLKDPMDRGALRATVHGVTEDDRAHTPRALPGAGQQMPRRRALSGCSPTKSKLGLPPDWFQWHQHHSGNTDSFFCSFFYSQLISYQGFPGGSVAKNPPANATDPSSIPGSVP